MSEQGGAQTRLAVYGTLAPGRSNAHELSSLSGRWIAGRVRGRLLDKGWGAAEGCPGLAPDPEGPAVDVHILVSSDLPAHLVRLDAFEGDGYRRVELDAETDEGPMSVSIYALNL